MDDVHYKNTPIYPGDEPFLSCSYSKDILHIGLSPKNIWRKFLNRAHQGTLSAQPHMATQGISDIVKIRFWFKLLNLIINFFIKNITFNIYIEGETISSIQRIHMLSDINFGFDHILPIFYYYWQVASFEYDWAPFKLLWNVWRFCVGSCSLVWLLCSAVWIETSRHLSFLMKYFLPLG